MPLIYCRGCKGLNQLKVYLGSLFQKELKQFPQQDQEKIARFIIHVQQKGFQDLPGRNKPSSEVPPNDPQWLAKVQYAQKHSLWHYHIGIPDYDESRAYGDKTSAYVLHYIMGVDFIKIIDFTKHPPFTLPTTQYIIS